MDKQIIGKLLDRAISVRTASDKVHEAYVGVLRAAYAGSITKEEDILAAKRDMMIAVVEGLPLDNPDCYFCVAKIFNEIPTCLDCPYKKMHGNCYETDSDFKKIIKAKEALISALHSYHRDGDTYAEEKPLGVGDVVKRRETGDTWSCCGYTISAVGDFTANGKHYEVVAVGKGDGKADFFNLSDLQRA